VAAGQRRLREELGIACALHEAGALVYQAEDPGGRGAEHEYDVLLVGAVDPATPVHADRAEVAEWRWVNVEDLQKDLRRSPETYAPWFHLGLRALQRVS
jgi:isopentenyl-diphosphate delta-isomerase